MCNRYRMTAAQANLAARYEVEVPYAPDLTIPPPELFPERAAWIVREEGGARTLDVMSWGFPTQIRGASGKVIEKRVTNVRNRASRCCQSNANRSPHDAPGSLRMAA
jgi:putative SOS response-associated peptidase YedK